MKTFVCCILQPSESNQTNGVAKSKIDCALFGEQEKFNWLDKSAEEQEKERERERESEKGA